MSKWTGNEIRWLQGFMAVAEGCSFSRAAKNLGVWNSQATRRVKMLEQRLGGVPLLYRTSRAVSLTEEGRVLYNAVRKPLADIVLALERAEKTDI